METKTINELPQANPLSDGDRMIVDQVDTSRVNLSTVKEYMQGDLPQGKQDKLNRTVGGNDNATGTVTDTGGNLSVPIPVTVVAPAASNAQITAGTRPLRATLKILIDNIAELFASKAPANASLALEDGAGTDLTTPAVASATVGSVLQTIWGKIRQVANVLSAHAGNLSNPHGVTKAQIGLGNVTNDAQVRRDEIGAINGVASLDAYGMVPLSQLPSEVGGSGGGGTISATTVTATLTDAAESSSLPSTATNTALSELLQTSRNNLKHLFNNKIDNQVKGVPNGVASLNASGIVPFLQLPFDIGYRASWEEFINAIIIQSAVGEPFNPTYTNGPAHGKGSNAFFGGVIAPNGKVIFVPAYSANVGIYDPIASTYTDGPAHGKGSGAFYGGVIAPNGKVIFVPRDSANVGIYDPIASTYTDGPAHGKGGIAFAGGVIAPNGKVIFVPASSANVGIYDPIASTYTDGPAHGKGNFAFAGGVIAPNGKVIFVPYSSANVGIYDPIASTYTDGPAHGKGNFAFYSGVIAPNGKVIFVPYSSANVGILSTGLERPLATLLSPFINKF